MLFNIPATDEWLAGLLLKLAGMDDGPRPSRLWRGMIKDSVAFRHSLESIMHLDFDRIVPGHGEIMETNAKRIFEDAFSPWLGGRSKGS